VLALEVGATARDPWRRTFDAANGAHVIATVPSKACYDGVALTRRASTWRPET
jgi:hypothetical protein